MDVYSHDERGQRVKTQVFSYSQKQASWRIDNKENYAKKYKKKENAKKLSIFVFKFCSIRWEINER